MKVEYIPVKKLTPYARNPRKNDAAVAAVAASIREFGFKVPIIVDSDGVIVAGHTRLKAAKKLRMKEVPVIVADDLTPDQIKAFRLADNKVSELAEWDLGLLDLELDGIDLDMSEFGFDLSEEEDGEPEEVVEDDYEPELPPEPKAKRGDIYRLGRHRLMCGDSTNSEDVIALMAGEYADLVFTDPPYGVDYASKNKYLNAISPGNRIQVPIENDALASAEEEKNRLWVPALTNAYAVADDKCSYYIASPQGGELMMMMMAIAESGWQLKHTIIWNKNNHVLGRSDYNYKHEPLLYGWKKQHNFYGAGKFKTSVWDIPKPQKSDLHPTMKPVELVAECMMNSSKAGDTVLDVFGGSGTTMIAAEQTGRDAYLMEIDPHYVDVIIDRWETFTGETAELITG